MINLKFLSLILLLLIFSCKQAPTNEIRTQTKEQVKNLTNIPQFSHTNLPKTPVKKNYSPATKEQIKAVNNTLDDYKIEYGYSFGMCEGFCIKHIKFSSTGIIKTKSNWKNSISQVEFFEMKSKTYNSLINSIKYSEFFKFSNDLGCGDCADGGKEWLHISNSNSEKKIFGTYGFEPPKSVENLITFLRKI